MHRREATLEGCDSLVLTELKIVGVREEELLVRQTRLPSPGRGRRSPALSEAIRAACYLT
jgi:hypothetical protein